MLCLLSEESKQPVSILPGVGEVRERQLAGLGIHSLADLLLHLPHRYEDWRPVRPRLRLPGGRFALRGALRSLKEIRRRPFRTILELDGTDRPIRAVIFGRRWLKQRLSSGQQVTVYGQWSRGRDGVLHCSGGQVRLSDELPIVPIYPAGNELGSSRIQGLASLALDLVLPAEPPVIPGELRSRYGLFALPRSLESVHRPRDLRDARRARMSLAFVELLLFYLAVGLSRRLRRSLPGKAHDARPTKSARLLRQLPFSLTGAQRAAIAEIGEDLARPRPAHRLIQGDVGSGKTVVAVWASVRAVECGGQAVWLVPTRLLAEQHHRTLRRHLDPLGISASLITAETEGDESADVVVGTHSLMDRQFPRLSLLVIDEQQRFGVRQRAALQRAGRGCDVLLLTATPIPRTLAGALFGGVDVTTLDEKPPGRGRVLTRIIGPDRREVLYRFLARRFRQGDGAYIICPCIEDTESSEGVIRGVLSRAGELRRSIPRARVALVHGQIPGSERREILNAFAAGDIDVIVGTTVLEVGLDVERAAVVVIENADHFGLAELHQLRGRVGRGSRRGLCFLVTSGSAGKLRILARTDDGFAISRLDMRLRGMGDLFSSHQHGVPPLLLGDHLHSPRFARAVTRSARRILDADPPLTDPAHRGIRGMLRSLYCESFLLARVL